MHLRRDLVFAAALALVTLCLFLPVRRFDFIQVDDPQYVQANDRVLQGLSFENVRWAFTTTRMANWHPLTWLSHMLDAGLFGASPAGPHVVNAIIHTINAALVYLILVYLTGDARKSVIVAALFAVHPLRIESVAWIAERKDVLCATFYLLAIGAYALSVGRRGRGWYAACVAAMALGMLAKPSIVTLPFALVLLDCWPLKRPPRAHLLVEKIPLFGLSLLSCAMTFVAQRQGGAMSASDVPLTMRIANATWAYARYLRKTIWPGDLAAFYPYPGVVHGTSFPWLNAAISSIVLLALTFVAIALWRRQRAVLVGWLWFLGVIVPTIGIVQVGLQSMADRYSYVPHIGLLIAIVWGVGALIERRQGLATAGAAAAIMVVIALAASTAYQLRYWENGYTLFRRALEVTDHNPAANMSVGIWLTKHGRGEEALPYYVETLRLQPNVADAHNNVGNYLRERGDLDGALRHLRAAVELSPKHAEARHNLANVLADLGQYRESAEEFDEAIKLDPDQAQFYYNFGVMLASAGQFERALGMFEHALALRPGYDDARFAFALALLESGRLIPAKEQLELALSAQPNRTDMMGRFAWVLATSPRPESRDSQAALQLAEHANKITFFGDPQLLDTLAAALASVGRFDQAISVASRGRDLALSRAQKPIADRIDAHLKLYRSGRAFIASTQPVTAPATGGAAISPSSASNPASKDGK